MPALLGIGPDNPVAWANFHRKGGFKTILGASGAYFGILGALIVLSARLSQDSPGRAYGTWPGIILGLQFLFVVVIGAGRVSSMIRGDLNSGMIESLRMMPLAAGHAVAGYLSAAAASLSGFFAANFLLGLIANALAELPTQRWVAANVILCAFALFVWTVAGFLAFLVKSAAGVLVIISLVAVFGNVGLLYVVPGLVVVAGPLIGGSIFDARHAQTELATPLVLSVAAQFLVGVIFFVGAARKYRRPDALALGPWLSLGLLLAFIGSSLLAILAPESFRPEFVAREFRRTNAVAPFCGSVILALLLALIPLANFARMHVGWKRGRADDPELRRAVPPLLPSGLIVTGTLALMIFALPRRPSGDDVVLIGIAFFGFCLSAIFVAAWFYRAVDNAKVILFIWFIAYCLVPLGIDFARDRLSDRDEPTLGAIASFSPIGLLIEAADGSSADLRPAAVFHCLVPLIPLGLYLRGGRRKRVTLPLPAR
jgi:hypothetical protein